MCGIAGDIRFNSSFASADLVQQMAQRLAPRGPDGAGVFAHNHFAFGHRRLKIVDLSEHAQQPMIDNALGLGIVFNGMIYNYPELRSKLQAKGYQFFSHGDTEVLLKAYHAWGDDFVRRLSGMFAFAIWERDSGAVLLGRDRLGIKPLYYTRSPSGLRFASSLPALLAGNDVDTTIDPVALHNYLTFHAVVPAPHTILNGVRKLAPGTTMRIAPDGTCDTRPYWELRVECSAEDSKRSDDEWKALLHDALRTAVRRRLVADVPVGVLLSGGVDSSLIVGLLSELGQHGLNTFSIGFEAVNGEVGDEFRYSDIVARQFGTVHHKIRVGADEMLDQLPACIGAMAEPMVSHDNIGFFLLSRMVSQHVRVVQSGQGADEVFGGYDWYPPLLNSKDAVSDYAQVFFDQNHDGHCEAVEPAFAQKDYSRELVAQHFARPGAPDAVDKALRFDTTVMLVDDPVKRVDNMTMAWGVEARVPFLDHDLVELAGRIPARLKVANGGKHILKEVARDVIPASVIDRPKGYFPVPALKYLRGRFLDLVRDTLSTQTARERRLFRPGYVQKLLADPESYITPLRGSRLWQVALLEVWLQTQGV